MSTYFYGLDPLISSVRCEDTGGHARITVWNDGANCGTLTVNAEDAKEFLKLFFTKKETAHRTAGPQGTTRTTGLENAPDSMQLLSEHGELTTKGELLK